MAQRKVTILDKAVEEVAYVGYFIEGNGLPETAKKFVDAAFIFFNKLSDGRIVHKPCSFSTGKNPVIAVPYSEKSLSSPILF